MAADTRDAPGKAPAKGFSLRSRLLGIPASGRPAPATPIPALMPRDKPPGEDQTVAATAEETSRAESAENANAEESTPSPVEKPAAPGAGEEDHEEDEPPRVGVALGPRRSLLSSALGMGDRKARAKAEEPPAPEAQAPVAEETQEAAVEGAPEESAEAARPEPAPEPAKPAADIFRKPAAPAPEQPAAQPETGHAPFVSFEGVRKTYDGANLVVKDLNLAIAKGEFLTLLGPSGSGKTTTLMMLAGFEQPTSGDILISGASVTQTAPHKRGLGFVFQNYALFPHMTVAENLAFPLEVRKISRSEIRERVAKALKMVELEEFDRRRPHQLSGGQQQRVAVARALVFDPELVLMDEPLGALDKHLREQMQYELKRLHCGLGVTVVYVTHDQGEALTLSDRIAVFHEGTIQQLDTPTRIYDEPANAFVAGFIGENNALPGKNVAINGRECTVELIGGARVRAANGNCDAVGRACVVCVRPEHLTVSAEAAAGGNQIAALIEDFIFHGDHLRVKLSAPGMSEIVVKAPARGARFPAKGVAVTLAWETAAARAFVS